MTEDSASIAQAIAARLGKSGLCVWPDFLSAESQLNLRADLGRIQEADGFHRAGTGQGSNQARRDLVRRDEVHWIDRETPTAAQTDLWVQLDSLKLAFNRTLYQGITGFEGHFAAYPAGGFYKRHFDRFQGSDARQVSLVLYLNPNWQPCDGGELRVYGDGGHVDVNPVGGTLVCFFSGESEHEVMPSHAARISFTGWFKQDALTER